MKPLTHIWWALIGVCTGLSVLSARASDIVQAVPLTKRVIMLQFDDGYVRHNARGEGQMTEVLYASPLNTANVTTGQFRVSSTNDPNFTTARTPGNVWRKARATDLKREYPATNPAAGAREHWIYLVLPYDLVEGRAYTVSWTASSLNTNVGSASFTFDTKNIRSEAVHVNLLGYASTAPKYAYISHWMGDGDAADFSAYNGQPFKVLRASDKVEVFSGTIAFRKDKFNVETAQTNESLRANFVGSDVYECNFSGLTTAGDYLVQVPNMGCSFPFYIKPDAHSEPFYWTMKAIYEQRSGIQLQAAHSEWPRPAPHNPTVTPGFAGRLKYSTTRASDVATEGSGGTNKTTIEAGYKGTLNTYGWYQDAGDWDGYLRHTHVPAYIMMAFEANPGKMRYYGTNGPESANAFPDLLDEARWLLMYFKRTKDEIVSKGWGTGGIAGSRVFGDFWGGDLENDILRGSWQDVNRDWYVMGEDPWTTYKYAGLAAQLAKIISANGLTDPGGVNWQTEAVNAYTWAKNNTRAGDETKTNEGIRLKDVRLYAAAALFRLTGQATYQTQFQTDLGSVTTLDDGQQDIIWGVFNYLKASGADANTTTTALNALNATADNILVSSANTRGMRFGGILSMPLLIGQATTPRIWAGIAAYIANKDRNNTAKATSYLNPIYTTADYFLGGNPLNMSWVSGIGERSVLGIFKMDWFANDNHYVGGATGDRKVIRPNKGVVPYGIWRARDGSDLGWWSEKYGHSTAYPVISVAKDNGPTSWPGHEMFFNDRNAPLPAEHTIDQTIGLSALTYGMLYAVSEAPTAPPTNTGFTVYDEGIGTGWAEQQWTWGGTTDLNNTSYVHNGSKSARVNITGGWGALVFNKGAAFNTSDYPGGYSFWVIAPQATQLATQLYSTDSDSNSFGWKTFDLAANTWTKITVSWAEMNNPAQVKRIRIGDRNSTAKPYTFYVDEVKLLPAGGARLGVGEETALGIRLYPNPATESVNVAFYAQKAQEVSLTVTDVAGRSVQQVRRAVTEGVNHVTVPVQLPKGMYLMNVQKDGGAETVRFVVQQ